MIYTSRGRSVVPSNIWGEYVRVCILKANFEVGIYHTWGRVVGLFQEVFLRGDIPDTIH